MLRLLLVAVVLALFLSACDSSEDSPSSSSPTPTEEPEPVSLLASPWSARAVWQPTASDELWTKHCGSPPIFINPTRANLTCAVGVMEDSRANPEAVEFFRTQGFFLVHFEELGPIDYGRAAAPWFNMGRTSAQLFLNGSPSIVSASVPSVGPLSADPTYAAAMAASSSFFPFLEYSKLGQVSIRPSPNVLETIDLLIEVRICRACDLIGFIHTQYAFGSEGTVTGVTLLPFVPP